MELTSKHIYDAAPRTISSGVGRPVERGGPNDRRMGTSSNGEYCETCGRQLKSCNGHFGYIKLALPVFHIGFLRKIIEVLQCICKVCGHFASASSIF